MSPKMQRLFAARWPELVVGLAPAVLYAPFLAGAQVFFWGTPLLQFYPWRWAALALVRAGTWPLWNPWLGNGAPLLANYQSALLYPPHWLAALLPLDLALNWLLVLHLSWTGLGMVTLARSLGFRPLGQAVAGLAFGLSQYAVARAGFYSINAALAWTPWVIWAGDQLVRAPAGPRRWTAALRLTALGAMQLLAGHAQTTWYTLLLLGVWVLARTLAARDERAGRVRALGLAAAAIGLAAVIAAAQLLPTAELLRESPRAVSASYEFVMTYSFSPWRLLTLLAPDLLGNPARGRFYGYGNYLEDAAYCGVLAAWLAGAAAGRILTRRKTWRGWPPLPAALALSMPVVVVLAMGRFTPVFPWLYAHFPSFNLFQAPTRMMVWFVFALALLAGWGADRWRRAQGRAVYALRLGAAGALSLCLTCTATLALLPPASGLNRQVLTLAGALLAAGVNLLAACLLALARGWLPRRRWQALVVLALLADLLYANFGINPGGPADLYRAENPAGRQAAQALGGSRLFQFADDEDSVRFQPYFSFLTYGPPELAAAARAALLANTALLDGAAAANNFDPLVSARYAAYLQVVNQSRTPSLLTAMNVGAVVSRAPLGWPVLVEGPDVRVYQAPGVARRAWVVYASRLVEDAAAARAAVAAPEFQPAAMVVLEPAGAEPPAGPPPAAIDPRDPNRFRLAVSLERAGWVVLADTYYPGWRAWVDGQPAAIQPANLAFRGVAVAAGQHELVFEYRPASFETGLVLSGLGAGLWLAAALWAGRRARAGAPR